MAITHITPENFDEVVKQADTPVIVDFWAPWCGPCQMMGPVFEELSNEYEGKLSFAKLNTEDHPELASQFGIQGIPTLIFVKGGSEAGRIVGFAPKDVLKAKIDEVLKTL
ncbi:MAG: thioredoxin [Simkania sp.]|nr:thioredoxin [Nanoarchaeota archaeon]MCB1084436.1 thioredoxin [Simkania sp.]